MSNPDSAIIWGLIIYSLYMTILYAGLHRRVDRLKELVEALKELVEYYSHVHNQAEEEVINE